MKLKFAWTNSQVHNEIKRENWRCVEELGLKTRRRPAVLNVSNTRVYIRPDAGGLVEERRSMVRPTPSLNKKDPKQQRNLNRAESLSDSLLGRGLQWVRTESEPCWPHLSWAFTRRTWSHPDWLRGERPKLLPLVNYEPVCNSWSESTVINTEEVQIHSKNYRKSYTMRLILKAFTNCHQAF